MTDLQPDLPRRRLLKNGSLLATIGLVSPYTGPVGSAADHDSAITVSRVNSNFEREPLRRPFGFKGGYMSEIWQTVSLLESSRGHRGLGLCSQNVLWSDAQVFSSNSEAAGNALMYAITEYALRLAEGRTFTDPLDLLDQLLPEVYAYAKVISGRPDLRKTFALNALVSLDNAAWMLLARHRATEDFDALIPEAYRPALSHRNERVASIPVVSYASPIAEIEQAVADGYFLLKIKLGQPGTQSEMLEKDKERLTAIHRAIGDRRTSHTKSGKLPYYFDANGRYESKDTLHQLIDHAKAIGAYDQIMLIEEPFPEHTEIDVHDIEVRLAADESAHTDEDARRRIEMGYRAIALKPVAKTMSMTLRIAQLAYEKNVPCFCADLTVNPILVEWNKAVAARLRPFPGLDGMGLQEINGHQNYLNWEAMRAHHPDAGAEWAVAHDGIFDLGADYYRSDGKLFTMPDHYLKTVGG